MWYMGTVHAMTDTNMVEVTLDRTNMHSGQSAWPDSEGVNARVVYLLPPDSPGQKHHSPVGVANQGEYKGSFDVRRNNELWDGGGIKG